MTHDFKDEHGGYSLTPLPGNCELVLSHDTWIKHDKQGQGFGQKQHLERLKKAQELGAAFLICTVSKANHVEKHILAKNGWRALAEFEGISGNGTADTQIWGRPIGEQGETEFTR